MQNLEVWRHRRRGGLAALAILGGVVAGARIDGQTNAEIKNTQHDLSASGLGEVRALRETRICVFCHTPHNAAPQSPLWNRDVEPQSYTVYASPTLRSGLLPQPTGPTKLCLTCHDGTVAMGTVLQPAAGIPMRGEGRLPPASRSDFGRDLSSHHPVSFPYHTALPNPELAASPPIDLVYGGTDEVHCVTCHDPHNDQYGRFLAKDNRYSALCVSCHEIAGWAGSAHATSTASVAGILPRPPKDWPTWSQLGEWGCEACHAPHFAATPQKLLLFHTSAPSPFDCTTSGCHSGAPGPPHLSSASGAPTVAWAGQRPKADIGRQMEKPSAHRGLSGAAATAIATREDALRSGARGVACADCHDPHQINDRGAEAPFVSGRIQGVSGVDRGGGTVSAVTFEYEICFKCHGDYSGDFAFVPRVLPSANKRLAFDTANPSYHPVLGLGRNLNIPSIPSSLEPTMSPSQILYCSACHADDEGASRGPHGSDFAPILRERYETAGGQAESYEVYALCYRCHERTSILGDVSFRKNTLGTTATRGGHSGHLAAGASCATCHDPHGVNVERTPNAAETGDHRHLINFDSGVVQPVPGARYPLFQSAGTFAGSCTLVCHGVTHQGMSYP
jgi:predicted CXXCH cytochrome family protein